jgi:hypothetical protein
VTLAYALRWLSKGVIERKTVHLILVRFILFLFGLFLPVLYSYFGPDLGPNPLPAILCAMETLSLEFIPLVYTVVLVIALILKV